MLTISKPLSAGQAQTYHAKEFTAPEQNYWYQGGEIQSEWHGKLAAEYGLADAVSAKDFSQLSEGRHPETGERALQPRALFESQQFATAVYQSQLTYQLRNLGYQLESGRSGAPEIKGYSREYLIASSPRSSHPTTRQIGTRQGCGWWAWRTTGQAPTATERVAREG